MTTEELATKLEGVRETALECRAIIHELLRRNRQRLSILEKALSAARAGDRSAAIEYAQEAYRLSGGEP